MARQLRYEHPGALWHVTSRGNGGQDIFFDTADRLNFLTRLGRAAEIYGWIIHAYVLMSNHVHIMLQTPDTTLSDGMKWLNSCYAMDINRKYDRTGHLFGERFKAFLIDEESYYYEVLRYVILNPVRAHMIFDGALVEHPSQYPWSSYRATAGLELAPSWLAVDKVWLAFSRTSEEAAQTAYREFVDQKLDAPSPFENVVGQIFLGPQTFIDRIRAMFDKRALSEAHPREQREVGHASATQVGRVVYQVFEKASPETGDTPGRSVNLRERCVSAERMLAAWLARLQGEKLRPIASMLGLTSIGHVSTLVKRCGEELAKDPLLRGFADQCRALIRELPSPVGAPPVLKPAIA